MNGKLNIACTQTMQLILVSTTVDMINDVNRSLSLSVWLAYLVQVLTLPYVFTHAVI
jgi:hypothetical protein